MKHFSNIAQKEIREMMTLSALIPMIIMAVMFASLGGAIGNVTEEAAKPPIIGLIDNDGGVLSKAASDMLRNNTEVIYNGSSVAEGLAYLQQNNGIALVSIDRDFTKDILANRSGGVMVYWIMRGTGSLDGVSSASLDSLFVAMDKTVSAVLIDSSASENSSVILNPTVKHETTLVKGIEMNDASPGIISSMVASQSLIIPIIIMMVIVMTGSIVVSSMGMEKENKTLETLLTMPVSRSSIVMGKLAGAAAVGLVLAFIYMLGMTYYMNSLTKVGSVSLESFGLTLNPLDYALVGVSLFLAVLGALSLCMLLGAFAKNYKSAQTMTIPVTFLAMVPMFVFMMKDFATLPLVAQASLFLIPFSHPMMAMNNLMFHEYGLVLAGIAYEAVFAAVTMGASIWLFKRDLLLTGRIRKGRKMSAGKGILRKK